MRQLGKGLSIMYQKGPVPYSQVKLIYSRIKFLFDYYGRLNIFG